MQLPVVQIDHSPVQETKNSMSTIEQENILEIISWIIYDIQHLRVTAWI